MHSSEKKIDRRTFLKGVVAAGAVAAIGGNEVKHWTRPEAAQAEEAEPSASHNTHESHEGPEIDFDALNRDTALPVTTAFLGFVANSALNGGSFDWRSILTLNGLEAARLKTLSTKGGEQGKHLAAEEAHEYLIAAGLGAVLVAIADFTHSSIRVNEQSVFSNIQARVQEHMQATDIGFTRPELTDSPEVWAAHVAALNKQIAKKAAQMQALTSVLAPFFTTYASSSIADQLQEGMAQLVFEQSYATQVVEQHAAGNSEVLNDVDLNQAAATRANELLSGPWGLTNLEITLAANIHGAVLGGDPPQLFGFANHWRNPARLAKAEAFGAVNSMYLTAVATSEWLRRVGVTTTFDDDAFADAVGEAYEQSVGLFGDIQFGSIASDSKEQLHAELQKAGVSQADAIVAAQAKMTVALGDYARERAEMARQLPGKAKDKVLRFAQRVGDAGLTAKQQSDQLLSFVVDGQLMPDAVAAGNVVTEEFYPIDGMDDVVQRRASQSGSEIGGGQVIDFAGVSDSVRAGKRMPVKALAEAERPKSHAHDPAQHEEHHPSPAQEVFYALGSQMPAVSPTAVLAEQAINKAFDLKGRTAVQERSPKADVLKAMSAALTSEALLSSLADNVAAYIYAEKLLSNIVKKVYGEDVLQRHPRLGDAIYAISLKLAEAAGSLTKLGNGPNFLMKRREFVQNTTTGAWEMQAVDVPFELYTNRYAVAANIFLAGESMAWLSYELALVEGKLSEAA